MARESERTIMSDRAKSGEEAVLRWTSVVGARPQFVKAAMIGRAVRRHNAARPAVRVAETLIHTGQHYDPGLSQVFFDQLDIRPPRINLGVGSGPHGRQTAEMLTGLESALAADRPDLVVVYGDTNTTLAGALAAAKLGIPIAHVEAGLRSRNMRMPEEINRVVADRLAALLFCPTREAVANLKAEGLGARARLVGDVMYDAFLHYKARARADSRILAGLNLTPRGYALATVHRQENTDDPERLRALFEAFNRIAAPDFPLIIPLHPRTRNALRALRPRTALAPAVIVTPPISYLDMIALEAEAAVVLTDSGGVQKEAAFAGVPCLTLRGETEWPETVAAGINRLVGADPGRIARGVRAARTAGGRRGAVRGLYGNGAAADRIVDILAKRFGARAPERG
jgi:UDP-N-acetylglucosamine 2-epimerase